MAYRLMTRIVHPSISWEPAAAGSRCFSVFGKPSERARRPNYLLGNRPNP